MRSILAWLICVSVLTLTPALAIVVTGNDPNAYNVAGGALGGIYDGVAALTITRSDGTFGCSGTLLAPGNYVLTAAHCLANASGQLITTNTTVFFDFGSGTQSVGGSAYFVNPQYAGGVISDFDIALIALNGSVNSLVPRYQLY